VRTPTTFKTANQHVVTCLEIDNADLEAIAHDLFEGTGYVVEQVPTAYVHDDREASDTLRLRNMLHRVGE
jgi:hypothetical protein